MGKPREARKAEEASFHLEASHTSLGVESSGIQSSVWLITRVPGIICSCTFFYSWIVAGSSLLDTRVTSL